MKKQFYIIVAFGLIVLVSCNKDDEIIIENPYPEKPGDLIENPFIADKFKVVEYLPAPGQFINDPAFGFDGVDSPEKAADYAGKRLKDLNYVSLGAWGGFIIMKSEYSINNSGDYDFAIGGNSFDSSNEPGIVWVMADTNSNGLPDDTWYELKGSYYGQEGYQKDYSVTYFRPEPDSPTPWLDSNWEKGEIHWLGNYHNQQYYYPEWITEDSYTLKGTRLPALAEQNSVTGMWNVIPFEWGYADNNGLDATINDVNGRTIQINYFRISDAVTIEGTVANLSSIDFVKVQSAVNSNSGWLGEYSTEVCAFFLLKK